MKDNIEVIRNDILNKGYYVIRNFFKKDEILLFRKNIEKAILTSPNFNYRINNNKVKDYSHNRSHDTINRTLRYYMFFHNEKSWNHKVSFIINKSINIRNEIEKKWDDSIDYINLKK